MYPTKSFSEISEMIQNVFKFPGMYVGNSSIALESTLYAFNVCRNTNMEFMRLSNKKVRELNGGCFSLSSVITSVEELLPVYKTIEQEILKTYEQQ